MDSNDLKTAEKTMAQDTGKIAWLIIRASFM